MELGDKAVSALQSYSLALSCKLIPIKKFRGLDTLGFKDWALGFWLS